MGKVTMVALATKEGTKREFTVEEAEYLLSCYYEPGHCRYEDRHENRSRYVSETGKLKRFIAAYKKFLERKEV